MSAAKTHAILHAYLERLRRMHRLTYTHTHTKTLTYMNTYTFTYTQKNTNVYNYQAMRQRMALLLNKFLNSIEKDVAKVRELGL